MPPRVFSLCVYHLFEGVISMRIPFSVFSRIEFINSYLKGKNWNVGQVIKYF